ncbi:Fpg/Nei family DNA glycosylase [Paenibacillus sp. D51F]
MPEYPEMDHYRMLLGASVAGQRIRKVAVEREKSVNLPAGEFVSRLEGRTIWFVERRGKHLIFHLDNGERLLLHLMLGGWMFYGSEEERPDRTVQVQLDLDSGNLYFIGLRLGYLHLLSAKETEGKLAALGPEPFDPRLTLAAFTSRLLAKKRSALKTVLVDQSVIAGIGNCYSDEIAWEAKLRPDAKLGGLSEESFARLYDAMHSMLLEARTRGGYMENPFQAGDESTGGYNDDCKVYDRPGGECYRCGGTIEQHEMSSRKVFFCPDCQKES